MATYEVVNADAKTFSKTESSSVNFDLETLKAKKSAYEAEIVKLDALIAEASSLGLT